MDADEPRSEPTSVEQKVDRILAVVTQLEARLDAAGLRRLPNDVEGANQDPRIQSLIIAGDKIPAIRAYRAETGVGLTEAKSAVEAIEQRLRATGVPFGRSSKVKVWRPFITIAAAVIVVLVVGYLVRNAGSLPTHW